MPTVRSHLTRPFSFKVSDATALFLLLKDLEEPLSEMLLLPNAKIPVLCVASKLRK